MSVQISMNRFFKVVCHLLFQRKPGNFWATRTDSVDAVHTCWTILFAVGFNKLFVHQSSGYYSCGRRYSLVFFFKCFCVCILLVMAKGENLIFQGMNLLGNEIVVN